MRRIRSHLTYANVMVTLLAFVVLAGGTAYAANTVFSSDIVNGEVKNDDLAANAVGGAKIADRQVKNADLSIGASSSNTIADGGVQGIDVANDSLTPTDIADVRFMRANTAQLNDQPGGSAASATLFTVGQVSLLATCSASATNLVANLIAHTTEVGPVLVTDGEAAAADFVTPLHPESVDFLMGVNATESAEETSFAILDGDGTTASGVAAASVDPETGECVINAQAVG